MSNHETGLSGWKCSFFYIFNTIFDSIDMRCQKFQVLTLCLTWKNMLKNWSLHVPLLPLLLTHYPLLAILCEFLSIRISIYFISKQMTFPAITSAFQRRTGNISLSNIDFGLSNWYWSLFLGHQYWSAMHWGTEIMPSMWCRLKSNSFVGQKCWALEL